MLGLDTLMQTLAPRPQALTLAPLEEGDSSGREQQDRLEEVIKFREMLLAWLRRVGKRGSQGRKPGHKPAWASCSLLGNAQAGKEPGTLLLLSLCCSSSVANTSDLMLSLVGAIEEVLRKPGLLSDCQPTGIILCYSAPSV